MKKSTPTRRRSDAVAQQRDAAARLRSMRESVTARASLARARRRAKKAKDAEQQAPARPKEYVVRHTGVPRSTRRQHQLNEASAERNAFRATREPGEAVPNVVKPRLRQSTNEPHINPARDRKPGARLRKEA